MEWGLAVVLVHTFRGLIDLSRARQALLSVAQPALGALLALGGLPDGSTMLVGLLAAAAGYLAVFSLNDLLDLRSDIDALEAGKGEYVGYDIDTAYDRHPVAAGVLRYQVALLWVASLSVVASALAWSLNPLCLALFAAAGLLEVLYCSLRSKTWMKTLVSGAMVGIGGLAGWVAVAPLNARALGFFAFLAAWEIAGRNLPNDLSDLEADSAVGLRTVATTFGPRASGIAIAAGAVATAWFVAFMPLTVMATAGSLAVTVSLMALPSLALLEAPTPTIASNYFNFASLVPAVIFLVVLVSVLVETAL